MNLHFYCVLQDFCKELRQRRSVLTFTSIKTTKSVFHISKPADSSLFSQNNSFENPLILEAEGESTSFSSSHEADLFAERTRNLKKLIYVAEKTSESRNKHRTQNL